MELGRFFLKRALRKRPAEEAADALAHMIVRPHSAISPADRYSIVLSVLSDIRRGVLLDKDKARAIFRALAAHVLHVKIGEKEVIRLICAAGAHALFAFATAPQHPLSEYTWKMKGRETLGAMLWSLRALTGAEKLSLLRCMAHLIPKKAMPNLCADLLREDTRVDPLPLHATAEVPDAVTLVDIIRAVPHMADAFLSSPHLECLEKSAGRIISMHFHGYPIKAAVCVDTISALEILLALASSNARTSFFEIGCMWHAINNTAPPTGGVLAPRLLVWRPTSGVASLQRQCSLAIHRRIVLGDFELAAACAQLERSIPVVNILLMHDVDF